MLFSATKNASSVRRMNKMQHLITERQLSASKKRTKINMSNLLGKLLSCIASLEGPLLLQSSPKIAHPSSRKVMITKLQLNFMLKHANFMKWIIRQLRANR